MESNFVHVDWLQLTFKDSIRWSDYLRHIDGFQVVGEAPYQKGYNVAKELKCGGIIMWSTTRKRQGIGLKLTGQPLARLRQEHDENDMIVLLSHAARKIARLDIALDVSVGFDFENWRQLARSGVVKSRMHYHKAEEMAGDDGGGVYWGAPTSSRRMRVYDRAAKMEHLSEALTRFEMQTRDKPASQAIGHMIEHGIDRGIRDIINSYWSIPSDWWDSLIDSRNGQYIEPITHDKPRWEKWLLETVLPSIQDKQRNGYHLATIKEFIDALERGV